MKHKHYKDVAINFNSPVMDDRFDRFVNLLHNKREDRNQQYHSVYLKEIRKHPFSTPVDARTYKPRKKRRKTPMRNKQVDTTERPPWDSSKNVIFAFGGKVRPAKKNSNDQIIDGTRRPMSAAARLASNLQRTPERLLPHNAPNTNSSGKMGTVEDELYDEFMLRLRGSDYFFGDDDTVARGGFDFEENNHNKSENNNDVSALDYIENYELEFDDQEYTDFGDADDNGDEVEEQFVAAVRSSADTVIEDETIRGKSIASIAEEGEGGKWQEESVSEDVAPESADDIVDVPSSVSESIRESIIVDSNIGIGRRGNEASLELNLSQEGGAVGMPAASLDIRSPNGGAIVVPTENGESMSFPPLRQLTHEYVLELSALQIAYLFKVFRLGHYKELILRSNLTGATLMSADEIKLYHLGFHFKPDRKKMLSFILGVKENSRRRRNRFTDMEKVKKIYVSSTVNKLFGALPVRPATAPTAARGAKKTAPLPTLHEEGPLGAEQQEQQPGPEETNNLKGSMTSSLTACSDADDSVPDTALVAAAQQEAAAVFVSPPPVSTFNIEEKGQASGSSPEAGFVRSPARLPVAPAAPSAALADVLSRDIFDAVSSAEVVCKAAPIPEEEERGGEYSGDAFENSGSVAYSTLFEEPQDTEPELPSRPSPSRKVVNRSPPPNSRGEAALESVSASSGRLLVGMRVHVNFEGKGVWYPARVQRCVDGSYDVAYEDGDSGYAVLRHNIRTGSEAEAAAAAEEAAEAARAAAAAATVRVEEREDEDEYNDVFEDGISIYRELLDETRPASPPQELEPHFMAETASHLQKLPSSEQVERVHEQHEAEQQHLPRHEDFLLAEAALQKHLQEQAQHEADLLVQAACERRERDIAARKIQILTRMSQELRQRKRDDQRLRDEARAAVEIQAAARGLLARRLVAEERALRREEVLAQIRAERDAEEQRLRRAQQEQLATVKIQNMARSKIARRRLAERREEVRRERVSAIRSRVGAERERQRMQQRQRTAATTIQTMLRGVSARREVSSRREQRKQQEALRRESTRRLIEQERAAHRRLLQERSAATMIQTRARILLATGQLKVLRDEKHERAAQLLNSISSAMQRRLQGEREAAIKIQCLIRSSSAKRCALEERERQRRQRARERREAERERQRMQQRQRTAATTIQTMLRGVSARREVSSRREQRKQQEALRRESTRRLIEQERALLLKQQQDRAAATKIQSSVRSVQAKKRTLLMKATGIQVPQQQRVQQQRELAPLPLPSSDKQLTKKTSEKQLSKKKSSSSNIFLAAAAVPLGPSQKHDNERDLASQSSHNADSFSGFTSINDMDDFSEGSVYELHDEIGADRDRKKPNELSYPDLVTLKPQQPLPKMIPAADDSMWMVVDDGTSKFYFNKVTKECSLEPPAELAIGAAAAQASSSATTAAATTATVEQAQKLTSGNTSKKFDQEKAQWTVRRINSATVNVIADEWEMHMDFETNRPFYYNRRTGVSTWELPANSRIAGAATDAQSGWNVLLHRAKSTSTLSSANSIGKEWVVYYDPDTDRHFFHSKFTGESTWELPEALLSSASAKPKNNQQDYLRVTSFLHTPNVGAWELLVDAQGQVFYFNKASGESKWRPPSFLLTSSGAANGNDNNSSNYNNNNNAYVDIDDEGDDAHHDAFTIDSENFDLGI